MSHYETDCLPIAAWAWEAPENMRRVILFVSATIQQRFETVATITADIEAHGRDSRFLFGSKRATFDHVTMYRDEIFAELQAARDGCGGRLYAAVDAVMVLSRIPGLGAVKAAFVAQMLGFEVGCLDTHNLRRFGLKASSFKWGKTATEALKRRKVAAYVDTCAQVGGSRYLWNSWCDYVADAWPRTWMNGEHVSAFHRKALGLL